MTKSLARMFKTATGSEGGGLSTIPPPRYAERFVGFMRRVFTMMGDDVMEGEEDGSV